MTSHVSGAEKDNLCIIDYKAIEIIVNQCGSKHKYNLNALHWEVKGSKPDGLMC